MKSIIIRRLEEIETLAIENSRLKVSSIPFKIVIPAGETQGVIPIDDIDINNDIVFLYINTRDGNDEADITQELGERPIININLYNIDTTITGFILKNIIIADDASTESVSGNVIMQRTLPPDRLIETPKSIDGSMLKDGSVDLVSIDLSSGIDGKFIIDNTLDVASISNQEDLAIQTMFNNFTSDYTFIDVDPLGGRQLILNTLTDLRVIRINLMADIAKSEANITIIRNAGSPRNLLLPNGDPVKSLKKGPIDIIDSGTTFTLVSAAATRDGSEPAVIPQEIIDQINTSTSKITVIEADLPVIRNEIDQAKTEMRLQKGTGTIPSTVGAWTLASGEYSTTVSITNASASTWSFIQIDDRDVDIANTASIRTNASDVAGGIVVKAKSIPSAPIRFNYILLRSSLNDDNALLEEVRTAQTQALNAFDIVNNKFITVNATLASLSGRVDDFEEMSPAEIEKLLNISRFFEQIMISNVLFLPKESWVTDNTLSGYTRSVTVPVNGMNNMYNVLVFLDSANYLNGKLHGVDYGVSGDAIIKIFAKTQPTMDLTVNYTAIHKYGSKIDVIEPPTAPIAQNITSTSVEFPSYGASIQVKLGWAGEWFDLPKAFSNLTPDTNYIAYARYKPNTTNGGSLDSAPTRFKTNTAQGTDPTNAPGPKTLLHGNLTAGFFGEVPASSLYTGTELATACSLISGVTQYTNEVWLKFAIDGNICFSPKRAIRNSLSYDQLSAANCITGAKVINKGGVNYSVRLWRGALTSPSLDANADKGAINSMWNKLLLPIHEQSIAETWAYPAYVGADVPSWHHGLGTGQLQLYSDLDLLKLSAHGDGSLVWCAELSTSNSGNAVVRGGSGISFTNTAQRTSTSAQYGWLPLLVVQP